MKSLIKIFMTIFFFTGIWAWVEWSSASIAPVEWSQLADFSGIPQNQQVGLPQGSGIHPLSFSSKAPGDSKIESYRYIYALESEASDWAQAIEACKAGDQTSLQKLLVSKKSVVLVDTLRFRDKTTENTPSEIGTENDVVGYCYRGSKYLKGNKQEFSQLFGHIPEKDWVVLVENPETRPVQEVPMMPLAACLLSLVLAIGLAVANNRSE